MQTITLEIDGMSCGHCVTAVQAALKSVPEVTGGSVQVGGADVVIDPTNAAADKITAAAISAIQDAGYDARVASTPTSSARADSQPASRDLPVSGSCCSSRPA